MTRLYPYSLLPVLSVAALLFFTAVLRGRRALGLTMYCLAIALWSGMLALIWIPSLAIVGERFAAIGSLIAATYLHAAYDVMRQRSYRLVWLAYATAIVLTLAGVFRPGLLYGPMAQTRGPLFWPAMGLAIFAAIIPLAQLHRAYRVAPPADRGSLRRLGFAGALCYLGGMGNAVLLAHGSAVPWGMLLVLASLLVLANVIVEYEPPAERKLLERSLLYSAVAAFLSAGFLFGVMSLMSGSDPLLTQYRVGALFLLFLAALAFEPIRQQLQEAIARIMVKGRAPAAHVARALERQEEIAEHARRLAEIGALTSAVAHEVRNPLGVLSAHLKLLARNGTEPETVADMQEQIDRAARFVEDLLTYGRPRPLELRLIDAVPLLELAVSTAKTGLGLDTKDVEVEVATKEEILIEADQAQLSQLLVILLDNAFLAVLDAPTKKIRVSASASGDSVGIAIEDSGKGVPLELRDRLFEPFVTSRKREGKRPGTGLGLAIARGIAERHHGTISADRSDSLGGARFVVSVPKVQPVLATTESIAERTRT
jgi:signal transduction histidine kinase